MKLSHAYRIPDLAEYINWVYFDHAWGMPVGDTAEKKQLRTDAHRMLGRMTSYTTVRAAARLFPCHAEGDDIVLHTPDVPQVTTEDKNSNFLSAYAATASQPCAQPRLPMLRQQHPDAQGHCLCLADFIRPKGTTPDTIGLFATTVATPLNYDDNYSQLLAQTLADRLAEAAAERLHEEVRKKLWGYAPDEALTMDELHAEHFQGIRPAVGYPSLPDLSINFLLESLLDFAELGITLTEHGMMTPHASVSGLMLAHPAAHYFSIGTISDEQLNDYAHRRGLPTDVMRTYLAANLQQKTNA